MRVINTHTHTQSQTKALSENSVSLLQTRFHLCDSVAFSLVPVYRERKCEYFDCSDAHCAFDSTVVRIHAVNMCFFFASQGFHMILKWVCVCEAIMCIFIHILIFVYIWLYVLVGCCCSCCFVRRRIFAKGGNTWSLRSRFIYYIYTQTRAVKWQCAVWFVSIHIYIRREYRTVVVVVVVYGSVRFASPTLFITLILSAEFNICIV